jgi:tyrosyl-tRNA synthetase
VGDPSGKSKTRPMLTTEQVEANVQTYLKQIGRVLDAGTLEIRHNSEWFSRMSFREVLALASCGTVAQMLARDDFRGRFDGEVPIGVHELLYPLMQGRDSVEVAADVELGGTDQTFNLLVGRDMQKSAGREPQVALTTPLLVGLDGVEKMSKSLGNCIGIEDSAREMFGKVMSIADALMENYFTLLTSISEGDFRALVKSDPRAAKERLGVELVTQYHGAGAAREAAEEFRRVFTEKQAPAEMPEMPWSRVPKDDSGASTTCAMLVVAAGHASSNSEARRLIQQKAVSIDGAPLGDPQGRISMKSGGFVLKTGKRRFVRIVPG